MQITAGNHTIPVFSVIEGQGGVQGVMCDTVQLSLMGVPTLEVMTAIMAGSILTDDGRSLAGYDGLAEVRLTLFRQPQDARDRAMQEMTAEAERRAEAERKAEEKASAATLAAQQAEQEKAQAQEQAAAKASMLAAVADTLPDELAVQHPEIYPALVGDGKVVNAGQRRLFKGVLVKAIVTVWDRPDQWPDADPRIASTLWTAITGTPGPDGEVIEDWVQPAGVHDAYQPDDTVMHAGKRWVSEVNDNVWEPGVYGWREETA